MASVDVARAAHVGRSKGLSANHRLQGPPGGGRCQGSAGAQDGSNSDLRGLGAAWSLTRLDARPGGGCGACLLTLDAHWDGVSSCGYSSDGQRLVSGGGDGKVKIWDAETGALIREMCLLGHGEHYVPNADGTGLLEATPGAWRWLRYQLFDDAGKLIDVVPVETFGELPLPQRMVVPAGDSTHRIG
jgi:hypothetical protein